MAYIKRIPRVAKACYQLTQEYPDATFIVAVIGLPWGFTMLFLFFYGGL